MVFKRVYKVALFDRAGALIRTVRVHAEDWLDAPGVAMQRFAEDKPACAKVRIR